MTDCLTPEGRGQHGDELVRTERILDDQGRASARIRVGASLALLERRVGRSTSTSALPRRVLRHGYVEAALPARVEASRDYVWSRFGRGSRHWAASRR